MWDGRRDIVRHSEASPRCRERENSDSIIPIGCISDAPFAFLFSAFLNPVKGGKSQKHTTHLGLLVCGVYCQPRLRTSKIRATHGNIKGRSNDLATAGDLIFPEKGSDEPKTSIGARSRPLGYRSLSCCLLFNLGTPVICVQAGGNLHEPCRLSRAISTSREVSH